MTLVKSIVLPRSLAGLASGFTLLICTFAGAQTTENASNAADKLREGHVLRSFQACKERGGSDEECKQELESLLQRDQRALARIASNSTDTNKTELVIAAARCYDPDFDYAEMIGCREAIADDLEAEQPLSQTAALPEPAIPADDSEPVSGESAENVESIQPTATPAPVVQDGVTAIPKRRPKRFGDIDWAEILRNDFRAAESALSAQAGCSVEPLAVPLANITAETTVGESFWRPVSGKLDGDNTEYDANSGLQVLICDFTSLARANLLFHENDGEVFRIDIFFQRHRCDDLSDDSCLQETITERANDIDLYQSAGSPTTYSAFGSADIEDQGYATRYEDLLNEADGKRRLNWSNCAKVPTQMAAAMEGQGMSYRCIVEADLQDGIWSSVSFLEIAAPASGDRDGLQKLASKMTFADESSERSALDRHKIYFQTVVGNRIASANGQSLQEEETPKDVVLIKEVSALDAVDAKPPTETQALPPGDQRQRMKVVLERLIGLSP